MTELLDGEWVDDVRLAMLDLGMTQAELARRAGMSPQAVSLLLRGRARPTVRTIQRLLEPLGMRIVFAVERIRPN